jgi:hypothetical protein
MYVDHLIPGSSIGFLALQYTPEVNQVAEKVEASNFESFFVESDYEVLTFVKSCPIKGEIFTLTKKAYNETYTFAFDIRYWNSY